MRAALYEAHKYDLGCPTEAKCGLYAKDGEAACAGCPKQLRPVEPMAPPGIYARLRFLTRLESLVAVGCRFGINDLEAATWQELIWLRMERDRMDQLVRDQREGINRASAEMRRKQAEVRAIDKLPPPGVSLFKRRK